jgi:hypothetical protein
MPKEDRKSKSLTPRTGGRKRKGAGGAVGINLPADGSTTTSTPNASGGSKLANRAIGGRERPNQAKAKGLTRRK